MKTDTKRQNFNITPEQEAEIAALQQALGASTVKDAILRAVKIVNALRRELRGGKGLYVCDRGQALADGAVLERLALFDLDGPADTEYKYLISRPHSWRRQLCIRGRRALASNVHIAMRANNQTSEEAAADWDLPPEAIHEIIDYCERNEALITMEAQEQRLRSANSKFVEPPSASERAA